MFFFEFLLFRNGWESLASLDVRRLKAKYLFTLNFIEGKSLANLGMEAVFQVSL